ncbi:nuclear pore complex protein Nup98-Nup96-like isoform X2 [Patiria miniata]|uniref:Nuclear pore complex protein Nup98-Nup96 n=1 Tax=Patiria miniata TaxID=46514 RepID=A0A913ZV97_PATMI|nr:nuclear pore complex protein Nup98-Nup96-like isoform X2 [Patiria miniata]
MFGANKAPFGTSSFGSGGFASPTASATPFGQRANAFGSKTPGATGFGTPSAFGAQTPAGSLFGTGASGGLFGSTGNTFGGNTSSGMGFGSNTSSAAGTLFSSTSNAGTTGLFSTPATSSSFGNFGSKAFGGTAPTGMFGQTTTSTVPFGQTATAGATGGLFGAASGGLFGGTPQNGTTVKFNPVTSTDTMVKGGQSTSVNTRHQVITAMKEYENKSFEELRMEDYTANRKGPSSTGLLGQGMTQVDNKAGGLFGQPTASSGAGFTFGQNKSTFGTGTQSAFGTSSAGLFGAQQTQQTGGLFGQKTGFGTTGSTGLGFGDKSTSAFGQTATKSLFGQPASTQSMSLFGSTPASGTTGFGTGSTFGGTTGFGQTQSSSLFGKPLGFGTTTTSTGLTLGSGTSTGLFGQQNKTGLSLGTGGTTGFGTGFGTGATQSTSLFGNKGTTAGFGGLGTGLGGGLGTGFGTTNTGSSLFGGATSKPSTLGGLGGFGATTGLGGGLGTGAGLGIGSNTAGIGGPTVGLAVQDAQAQQQLLAIFNSPYGDNPLFRNRLTDSDKREDILKPTSKAAQKALTTPLQHKVSARPAAKLRPKPLQGVSHKSKLFEGLDDEDPTLNSEMFVPRRSVKKLVIKKKEDKSESDHLLNSSRSLAQEEDLLSPMSTYPIDTTTKRSISAQDSSPSSHDVLETPGGTRLFSKPQAPQNDNPSSSSNPKKQEDPDCTITDLNVKAKSPSNLNTSEMSSAGSDLDQSSLVDTIHIDDNQENTPPPHPGGVVLHRAGYYTIPSMEELAEMVEVNEDSGRVCLYVEDLTIGRAGYGSVFFPGVTDLAGINLDEIVHFRRKEITVYPDDTHKPSVGEGLNKKAEVTLDRTWPTDKTSRKPITDVDRLIALNYEEKLERATIKLGAKYVEYRPETGSWVFQVQHFSKYGLSDSDEEEEPSSKDPKKQKTQQKQKPPQKPAAADKLPSKQPASKQPTPRAPSSGSQQAREPFPSQQEEEPMRDDMDLEMMRDSPMRGLGGFSPKPYMNGHHDDLGAGQDDRLLNAQMEEEDSAEPVASSHRLANVLGMNTHRMQVMKGSFFADEDPVEYDYRLTSAPVPQTRPSLFDSPSRGSPAPKMEESFQERGLNKSFGGGVWRPRPLGSPAKYLAGMGGATDSRGSPIPRTIKDEMLNRRDHYMSSHFAAPKPLPPPFTGPQPLHIPSGMTQDRPGPRLVGSRPQQTILPLNQSVIRGKVPCIADTGLVMSRSFRVGWGPNWTLVHSGKAVGQRMSVPDIKKEPTAFPLLTTKQPTKSSLDATPFTLAMERVNLAPHLMASDNKVLDLHERSLDVQLRHSLASTQQSSPVFAPERGIDCLHHYAKTALRDAQEKLTGDQDTLNHSLLVWKLLVALWGRLPNQDEQELDPDSYPFRKARREAFSEWLASASRQHVNREVQAAKFKDMGHIEAVYSLLTGRQIGEACAVAQRSGDHRLALLLAQAGSTNETKKLVAKQLGDWHEMGIDKFMAPEYLRVYAVLAGILVLESAHGTINTCRGLDWKRALAVHLWHACSPVASVSDALEEYETGFLGQSALRRYCPAPRPPYMENNPDLYPEERDDDMGAEFGEDWREAVEEERFVVRDMCFHLVKLYADRSHRLERVLAPTTHTANQLDYRLSWHVLQALQALGFTHLSDQDLAHLHTSYAAQLEALGLWHWAAFVLLHIQDDFRREYIVRQLLKRQCSLKRSEENAAKERFLVNQLHIPPIWISEAKAFRAQYEGRHPEQAWHLLQAGHWNESHSVIIKHLAADAIISENYNYLLGLLKELVPSDRSITIQDWATNGQVFLDFINIVQRLDHLQRTEPTTYELEKLYPDVASLCSRVGSVTCRTAKDRLCQSEMAKRTANVMKAVLTLQQQSLQPDKPVHIPSRLLAPHVGKLPMPEDYGLQELRELTRSYMVELTA